tara:strand:+ start:161 stop:991 length:831 start_codon:yes stop_codon:yes gene_type:complete
MYIEIKNLNYAYNINSPNTLNNLNLNVGASERLILAGPNGAGKSTLLRLLAGKHMASNVETFTVLGVKFTQVGFRGLAYCADEWTKKINFVGYTPYVIDMEVKDFMKKEQENNIERRDMLCKILKINLNWNMMRLSDGQRRRVQIMLGLLKPFKLLLLDEITSELDIIVRTNLLNYLKEETIKNNASIIYATHILDGLEDWATGVLYLNYKGEMNRIESKELNVKNIIVSNMSQDYKNMEDDNILEVEARKDHSKDVYGKSQGGFSSGRSTGLFIN